MDFVKIDSSYKDIEKLKRLKEEAFPSLDNINVETFIIMQENAEGHSYAVYDEGCLIGYIVFIEKDSDAYIVNLAVEKNARGKSYGSKILNSVMNYFKKKNPNAYFALVVEKPHENAENLAQRQARIKFYERQGFYLTDLAVPYHGEQYILMTTEKEQEFKKHQPFSEYVNNILDKYDF